MRSRHATLLILLLGCDRAPPTTPPAPAETKLAPQQRLARASMALNGKRPSLEDLRAVAGDPALIDSIVDRYLDAPELGGAMRDLHNDALLVRTDFAAFPAGFEAKGALSDRTTAEINSSLMEAPLALIEYIIVNDRPYTEIVTASYTLADDVVAKVWGDMPYSDGGPKWQVTVRADERGNAGILSDSWLFSRHATTVSNMNRGRANAVSRALLCYDFLDRSIAVDTNLDFADPDAVRHAVKENKACASCHQTLDPLASFFEGYFPIYVPGQIQYPFREHYTPSFLSQLGATVEPAAYFGEPGESLEDLGRLIAADPRFALCAARRFYAYFHQIDLADVPSDRERELTALFVESGFSAKALARAIVTARDFNDARSNMKHAGPEQLSRLIEDLTGFRWTASLDDLGRVDLTTDSFLGYKVLAGGIDAYNVTLPSRTFNATMSLFLAELASRAAAYAVEKQLLRNIDPATRSEAQIRPILAELHQHLLIEQVTAESLEVGESWALFEAALFESNDVKTAWKAVLTAMLQDFRIATY